MSLLGVRDRHRAAHLGGGGAQEGKQTVAQNHRGVVAATSQHSWSKPVGGAGAGGETRGRIHLPAAISTPSAVDRVRRKGDTYMRQWPIAAGHPRQGTPKPGGRFAPPPPQNEPLKCLGLLGKKKPLSVPAGLS